MTINQKKAEKHYYNQERLVCITASLLIVASSVISLFNGIIRSFITLPFKLDTLFVYGVFLLVVLFSINKIIHRSTPWIYVGISVLLFSYLVAFMINSNYYIYFIDIGFNFLIQSAPWLIVAYAVRDYKLFKKYLYFSAIIILGSFMANIFVFGVDMLGGHNYQQQYTYLLLPTAIILEDTLYDKKSFLNFLLFIITILFMFSMGARGPLVCVVLYILLKNYANCKSNTKKTVFNSVFLTIIGLSIYIFFYDILSKLLLLYKNMNMSTRTIVRLMEGNFFEDNARSLLLKYSYDLIRKYPFIGVGVGTDRILLASKMENTNLLAEVVGWYPHNIFLEILLHFGVFVGGVIIIFMIRYIYISIIKSNNKDATDIICIFVGIGLFPLLFSGSYITSPEFFALIGFCLYQYKNAREGKIFKICRYK